MSKTSEQYWKARDDELYDLYEKEILSIIKELKKAYTEAFINIKTEIKAYKFDNKTYNETAVDNLLMKIDAVLGSLFALEEQTLSDNITTFYQTNSARVGEFLEKVGIQPEVVKYTNSLGQSITTTRNMVSFNVPNIQAVENVIKEKFLGHNFSDRIWNNKSKLSFTLKSSLTEGLIRGESYGKIANRINKQMGTSFYNCERLARTEIKRSVDKAKLDKYSEAGITEYKLYTAHDNRVCNKCKEMDGKIFKIEDAKPGVSYLIHPGCRDCIIPIISFD